MSAGGQYPEDGSSRGRIFSAKLVFWCFCGVVFSKIAWYDLRHYVPRSDRRDFVTLCFAIWVVALVIVFIPVARSMLREVNWIAWCWILAVVPYFVVGVIQHGFNDLILRDFVRYALPLGYLLFAMWAVKRVPMRSMLLAIGVTLGSYIAIRTILHLVAANRLIRYGVDWEVMFPCVMVALALWVKRSEYLWLLLGLLATAAVFTGGQTRSVLMGAAIGAAVVGGYGIALFRKNPREALKVLGVSAFAMIVFLIPILVPIPEFGRLHVAGLVVDRDESPGRTPWPTHESSEDSQVEDLKAWEDAVASGGRSLDVRLAESAYYLRAMSSDYRSLLLGVGAGDWLVLRTPWGDRIVRGAHNTYITLLHRHGIILGVILSVFVACFGLRTNMCQALVAPIPEQRILLVALVSYRFAALAMSMFHQGLFDDPLVFLSVAIAVVVPRSHPG